MIWQGYELSNEVLEANTELTLWKSDRGSVEIGKATLAVAVTLDGKTKGYIFGGNGNMILDTIVETEEGAIGNSTERKITEPFLMLGHADEVRSCLISAVDEEKKDFMKNAEDLHRQFFKGRHNIDLGYHHDSHEGMIFAFKNDSDHFDLLIPRGSKIVYQAKHLTFISDENKIVMKTPERTIVTANGRCVVVKERC